MKKQSGFTRREFQRNSGGFSAIEAVLVLAIIGILGGTGWYVYNARNKTNSTYSAANQVNSSTTYPKTTAKKKPAPDPTADWTAYSDKAGVFSLKYPKAWVTATHPELCSPGILLLGSDSKSVGACASESFGQISVVSVEGDTQRNHALGADFKDINTTSVVVDGITGQKQTGTAINGTDSPGALVAGTYEIRYMFYANGRDYSAIYLSEDLQGKAYTDAIKDFNLMVTKTLKSSV